MVSGSKLKNPSKVSGDSPISLYYSLIYGNCLGNVVMGIEKCGKMCKNVEKCVKMCWRPVFYILLLLAIKIMVLYDMSYYVNLKALSIKTISRTLTLIFSDNSSLVCYAIFNFSI